MIQSMSRKGNCLDNAPAESFFKKIKVERIYHRNYLTIEEVRSDLFEYIEIFLQHEKTTFIFRLYKSC